jgi:hypothetical protein
MKAARLSVRADEPAGDLAVFGLGSTRLAEGGLSLRVSKSSAGCLSLHQIAAGFEQNL